VTITRAYFTGTATGTATVKFGGVLASVVAVDSSMQIRAAVGILGRVGELCRSVAVVFAR
jgi:hypothetical protein